MEKFLRIADSAQRKGGEVILKKDEIKKVLSVLRGSYPKYYKHMNVQEQEDLINVWTDIFEEDEGSLVFQAVKNFIRSNDSGFPPVPGQITNIMYDLTHPDALTEQEAWNLVYNATCNSVYNAVKEFEALPEQVQRVVGSPRQLREWGLMDNSTVSTIVSSNFQRSYRNRVAEDREYAKLPEQAKQMIQRISDARRIE